jgi:16S rRNA (adenine1518-N6/adenine1519-N6)-dimethyltransferase
VSASDRLRAHGLRPKKRFGQNFLADPHAAGIIAEAATTPPGGTVLEIGAGLGALTRPLLARAARVVAIERDRELVPLLAEDFAEPIAAGALTIVEADALRVDWPSLLAAGPAPRTLAGNLPYQITGALLEQAVHVAGAVDRAVFMVQAEVADRIVAAPGSDAYGALSVFVQAAFSARKILGVKAGAFHPRPDVASAVVLLIPARPPLARETEAFRQAVKAAFGARRKTLRNAWRGLYGWTREELEERASAAGISLDARGETLSVEAFARIASGGGPEPREDRAAVEGKGSE